MPDLALPDGIDALMAELSFADIMRLIERTARWVDPATFKLLPVWYPEHSRKALFYKKNWSEPQLNTSRTTGQTVHKVEGNVHANKALTHALGLSAKGRTGWSCCHIWGVDDPRYQETNVVVQDPKFFSCVANMVLLPTPLKAFTDSVPDVKVMLRICARSLYGWQCDHDSMVQTNSDLDRWDKWNFYPESWPREQGNKLPRGTVLLNQAIRSKAQRRWDQIRSDLKNAGREYPRESVMSALRYWNLDPEQALGA